MAIIMLIKCLKKVSLLSDGTKTDQKVYNLIQSKMEIAS